MVKSPAWSSTSLSPETPSTERSPAGMRTKSIAELGISMVTSRSFLGAAEDAEVRVIVPALEAHGEFAGVVGITPAKVDRDVIVAVTYDPEFTGTQVQAQLAAGREIHHKRMILKVFDLDFGVRKTRRHQHGQRRKQGQN